jgi:uncharacterized membrane protein
LAIVYLGWKRDRGYVANETKHTIGFWMIIEIALASLLPIITVIGTQVANTDGDRTILLLAILVVTMAPMILLARMKGRYEILILSVSITLLMHRALMTNFIMGYDIFSEYAGATITINDGFWNVFESSALRGGGANTALSIVTLAPMLNGLTGINALGLLKDVYPAIYAFLPLGLYKVMEGKFDRRIALVGIMAFMAYPPFYTLMIQLAKQQVAELFLVGMLLIITDSVLPRGKRRWMLLIFLIGVMVSHYAIAFLALGSLALLIALGFVITYLGNWKLLSKNFGPRSIWKWLVTSTKEWWHEQRRVRTVTLDIILIIAVFFLIWYSVTASGLQMRFFQAGGASISQAEVVSGSNIQKFDAIEALLINYGSPLHNFEKFLTLSMQILTLIGLAFVITKFIRFKEKLKDEFLLLGIVGVIIIAIAYTVPDFSRQLYYGRLFHFTYIFLAGYTFIGVFAISTLITEFRGRRADSSWEKAKITNVVCVVLLVLMFAFGTNLIFTTGDDYNSSYSMSEKTSGSWYSDSDVAMGQYISVDSHIGNTSVIADWHRFPLFSGLSTNVTIMPYSLNQNDSGRFVYVSSWMAETKWAYPLNVNGSATLTYCPLDDVMQQLNGSYDVVYTVQDGYLYYIPAQVPNTNPPGPPIYTYQNDIYYFVEGVVAALAILCAGVIIRKTLAGKKR